jgi:hypothetical protein
MTKKDVRCSLREKNRLEKGSIIRRPRIRRTVFSG